MGSITLSRPHLFIGEAVDPGLLREQVYFSVNALGEGHNAQVGVDELLVFDRRAVDVAQAEDLAGAEITVDVDAVQPRYRGAAIDVTTDHRAWFAIERVFPNRRALFPDARRLP